MAATKYDNGEALNMPVVLVVDPAKMNYGGPFPFDRIPMMVWQANLFGRTVLNMVLREELLSAYEALDRELRTVGELQRSLLPRSIRRSPRTILLPTTARPSVRVGTTTTCFHSVMDGSGSSWRMSAGTEVPLPC
jgi:sigma-B regulation protein RsbU (phosphoserine phosphatase)